MVIYLFTIRVSPHLNVKRLSTWPMPLYFQTSDPPEDGDVALLVTGGPQGFVDFLDNF